MRVVVPFASERPKTRLDGVLTPLERVAFSRAMLADVLDAVLEAGHEPEILATAPIDSYDPGDDTVSVFTGSPDTASSSIESVPVSIDDQALTPAINRVLEGCEKPIAVVMADLALATPVSLSRLFAAGSDVVLAPGRGGGTNALLARHPEFRVDYHGTSYLDHLARAEGIGASVETIDSFRLATDVDEPADLAEVLLHGENRATRWLRDAGFSLAVRDGRVGVERADVP